MQAVYFLSSSSSSSFSKQQMQYGKSRNTGNDQIVYLNKHLCVDDHWMYTSDCLFSGPKEKLAQITAISDQIDHQKSFAWN